MNIKLCKTCAKFGLEGYDFRIKWSSRNGRYYYSTTCMSCEHRYNKQYYKNNPEYSKQYYTINKNNHAKSVKNWATNNPEKRKLISKNWAINNYNRKKELDKNWKINNPEKVNLHKLKRKRLQNVSNLKLTRLDLNRIKSLIMLRNKMNKKAGIKKYHIDHITPLSKGGLHHPNNLRIITGNDNLQKANKLNYILQNNVDIRI